jgi:hypothetical protein
MTSEVSLVSTQAPLTSRRQLVHTSALRACRAACRDGHEHTPLASRRCGSGRTPPLTAHCRVAPTLAMSAHRSYECEPSSPSRYDPAPGACRKARGQHGVGGVMMSGVAVRQLAVFQSRPVSRLRYTQLGVLGGGAFAHQLRRAFRLLRLRDPEPVQLQRRRREMGRVAHRLEARRRRRRLDRLHHGGVISG